MNKILYFTGEYRFLSNFYASPIKIFNKYDQEVFPTVEHAYQAFKTTDRDDFIKIANSKTPYVAKKLGKTVKLRPNWETIKYNLMYNLVYQKFIQNPELYDLLNATKTFELIEGNTWGDTYWGQCPIGNGSNNLGKILMSIRDNIFTI